MHAVDCDPTSTACPLLLGSMGDAGCRAAQATLPLLKYDDALRVFFAVTAMELDMGSFQACGMPLMGIYR